MGSTAGSEMCDFETCPTAKHGILLRGARVDLVALAERHLPLVIAWRNNPAIRQRFFNRRIFTIASELAWFGRYAVDPSVLCFVIRLKSGRTIGMAAISKIDWHERIAEFGRFLIGDPLSLGRGYGRDAAQLVLEFATSRLGLRSISLGVMPDNVAAVALYRRLGFVETAISSRETSDGETRLQSRMLLRLDVESGVGSPESDSVPS